MENMANGPSKQLASYLLYKKNQNRILKNNDYRIYDLEFFDATLRLVFKKGFKGGRIMSFVHNPLNRHQLLKNAISNGKIEFLLRRLSAQSEIHKTTNLTAAVIPLLSVWTDFQKEFAEHWRNVWTAIKSLLLTGQIKKCI